MGGIKILELENTVHLIPEEFIAEIDNGQLEEINISLLTKKGDKVPDKVGINLGQAKKNSRLESVLTILKSRLTLFPDTFLVYTDDQFKFNFRKDEISSSITTEDSKTLGKYLKHRIGIDFESPILISDLEKYGRTDIKLTKFNDNVFYLDFSAKKSDNFIKNIKIKRFKSLKDINTNLEDINLLIGGNNSGKSSFLQALHFGISCGQSLKKYHNKGLSTTISYEELFYRPINNIKNLGYLGVLGRKKEKEEKEDKHIEIIYENRKNSDLIVDIETGRARGPSLGIGISKDDEFSKVLFNLKNSYSYYVTGVAGIQSSETLLSPGLVKEAAVKGSSNSVFRNIIYLLSKDKCKYKLFSLYLKKIFPNIELKIKFDELDDKEIIIEAKNEYGNYYSIDSFGTSILQTIQILSYIFLFNPSIIILDEPDAHLHPDNQIKIVELLYQVSKLFKIQLIISTHSKYILDYMLPNSNLIWMANGEIKKYITEARNEKYADLLSDIGSLSDITNLNEIKYLCITEDAKTDMFKILLESSGFNMREVKIWSYKSCSNLKTAKLISDFMKLNFPNLRIIIHRDRDYLSEEFIENEKTKFLEHNINLFIPERIDIESYFCSPEHINILYPELTIEIINDTIKEISIEKKDSYLQDAINGKVDFESKIKKDSNVGQISVEIANSYDTNYLRLIKGKKLLNILKDKLKNKTENKNNLKLDKITEFLNNEFLSGLL